MKITLFSLIILLLLTCGCSNKESIDITSIYAQADYNGYVWIYDEYGSNVWYVHVDSIGQPKIITFFDLDSLTKNYLLNDVATGSKK